jgi:TolA-binding protein
MIPAAHAWQATTQPSAITALAEEATRLQNSGKFAEAANQWQKIISTQPDWPRIGVAYLNLGVCKVSQGKFSQAFDPLKQSLKLSGNPVDAPKALMFLGYAQMNHGNQLSLSKAPADLEASSVYLTTATQTLGKIPKSFPDFELSDQAIYFRGQSFYKLERLNEAIAEFEKVTDNPDATFRKNAFFDMANAYQRQGELTLAQSAYQDYYSVAKSEAQDDPDGLIEASLRTAKAELSLASIAADRGDLADAAALYRDVEAILQPLVDDPNSDVRDEAIFNSALAAVGLGEREKAASMFATVASLPDSILRQQSAVLAGRELSQLGQHDRAIEMLSPIAESDSRFGIEAAIFLSTALRMTDRPQDAIAVTQKWTTNAPTASPLLVPLLMEQADATYMIPGQKKQAAKLYTNLALEYPQSPQTADALYKAAAANWETFQSEDAVLLSEQLIERFPNHRRIPSAKSILADAAIAEEDFAKGESLYRDLSRDYPNDPNAGRWKLRIGWALFLQDKYAPARDFLKSSIDTILRPQDQSEAFHWIGESAYELKDYRNAISALNQALESATPWDRLDATLFTRMQAELGLAQFDDALATVNLLQKEFPNSKLVSESLLRTGEAYLEQQKFPEAISQYKKVINQYPKSEFLPSALYGLGWAQLRSGQFESAEATFDDLITTFPTINLSQQARVGRSIAQRRLGKTDSAITDLMAFIKSAPAGERKNNSMLELGLAYVENESWLEAEKTFTELLAIKPKTSLADRAHYEMAWVLKRLDKPQSALAQFQQLVDDYPNSALAAEAYYEMGVDLYQRKEFQTAGEMFEQTIRVMPSDGLSGEDAQNGLLEQKALYQLAWSHYKLKEFDTAAKGFLTLVDKYPDSDRVGDALFVRGQALFQLDNFSDALVAYQAARPKLETSPNTNQPQLRLLMLQGAQSANQVGEFQTALDLATPLTIVSTADAESAKSSEPIAPAVISSAWLEIAKARMALGETDGAKDALSRASKDLGKTGAQARVIKGDMLLEQKDYKSAINEYKLVFYGYGGTKSTDEIRALQAYAIYETARANYSRVADASPRLKPELIAMALKHFRYLADNYSDQPLAKKAAQQIKALEQLQK